MGVYDNLAVSQSLNTIKNAITVIPPWEPEESNLIPIHPKCKCPNPKHTQGCSIEPTGEYCEWCSKGCRKRVMVVHIKYE